MPQYTGHPKLCNIYSSSWKVHIRSSNLFGGAAKCDVNNVCQERAFKLFRWFFVLKVRLID